MTEEAAAQMEESKETEDVQEVSGQISVTAEDMLPIIKKWLYSEHDIFLRELVSNAMDAVTKHQHLCFSGEAPQKDVDYKIEIAINKSAGTIHVKDNGIGMTSEEVKKYITQLAFSGATEFFDKYHGKDESKQIIGHFGLGFYSAFMVAEKVEIKTLSYTEGETGVHWVCDGSTQYTIKEIPELKVHGTEIILHINDDSKNFLEETELREVLKRHSEFLPVSIFLNGTQTNTQKAIWMEQPTTLKDEDYQTFQDHIFPFHEKSLFHLHFNIDTPFQVRGILYFHKVKQSFESFKGRIKLFCNRVFVSDSIEDIFPSYLFMLQGVIDCPDVPLNVSRSALQGDPRIKKIGQHMVKKIADKLKQIFRKDREKYDEYWEDINPFVKFGLMQDEKFYERMNEFLIFRSANDDKYKTFQQYLEDNKEKNENTIFYATDVEAQASLLNLFKQEGREVLVMDEVIDSHLIQHLEIKNPEWKFARIDSDLHEGMVDKEKESTLVDQDNKTREQTIKEVFDRALGNDKITVRVEHLKTAEVSGMVLLSEHVRRFREISSAAMQQMPDLMEEHTLVVNAQHPVVQKVYELEQEKKDKQVELLCQHVHDLAQLSNKNFDPKKLNEFIQRSNEILGIL
ncbi:molecular chaperone HtpG [bacterium]|nr:molecular chaperone HtpG [bacterium]